MTMIYSFYAFQKPHQIQRQKHRLWCDLLSLVSVGSQPTLALNLPRNQGIGCQVEERWQLGAACLACQSLLRRLPGREGSLFVFKAGWRGESH